MFSERLKEWINDTVKDNYLGDIKRDIALFEKSLALKAPEEKLAGINEIFPTVLEEMSNAASIDYIKDKMDKFVKIEPFLRHLLGVLYPERYKIAPREEIDGLNYSEWTLAPLLKQGFGIIPVNYNLSTGNPTSINWPYKMHYDLVYNTRNVVAHDFINMTQKKIFEILESYLIVYLDVSARFCYQIEEAYSKESVNDGFLAMQYCREIVQKYNHEHANGFHYIDIKWKAENSASIEYSTVETMMNDETHSLVKILGEAGCGKTTIMRQLEYLTAKKYTSKKSSIIPVFIQLINIETDSSLHANIKNMICNKLGVASNLLEEMLSINSIRLYLDGFNEILDLKLKKQIAWSIDELHQQYPELKIFLSDRSLVRSSIVTMRNALIYKLYPLDNEMKEKFIKFNCPETKAKEMLLQYFEGNPNYYENFNTPIKLKQLIEITVQQQKVPEDFCGEYIRFLFDREMIEKKDENVEYLEVFACALALSEKKKFSEYEAEAIIAKCKQLLGYTIPDSRRCLRLLIEMGILAMEDGMIEFKYSSYGDYFWMAAFERHLEELLEVD